MTVVWLFMFKEKTYKIMRPAAVRDAIVVPHRARRGWLLNCRGHVTDEAWTLIHALTRGHVRDSDISFALNISRGTIRYNRVLVRPSDRPGVAPPGVSPTEERAIRHRRALVKVLAQRTLRVVGPAPAHWVVERREFQNARAIQNELRVTHNILASVWTVRRDLFHLGMTPKMQPRAPRFRVGDPAARLQFCRDMANITDDEMLFSDEKYVDDATHGTHFEWCFSDQLPTPRTQVAYGVKVHVWGLIGIGVKKLVLLDCHRVSSQDYIDECLKPSLHLLRANTRGRGGVQKTFMQDGAKAHTSKLTMAWLASKGVKVIQGWPARSPDLNPIENLWSLLADRVSARMPTTDAELRVYIVEEWARIPQSIIDRFVRTFKRKLAACLSALGKHFHLPKGDTS